MGKLAGRSNVAMEINSILDNIKASLLKIYRELELRESHITAEKLRNVFLGFEIRDKTLLTLFQSHNDDVETLLGISKSKATVQKYKRTYN